MWRLVLGDLLPDLGEVEDPLPGAARVDGVGEQRLVVVRADEAGVAVLLQQQHVHVLGGLVVGVPGHNIIKSTAMPDNRGELSEPYLDYSLLSHLELIPLERHPIYISFHIIYIL